MTAAVTARGLESMSGPHPVLAALDSALLGLAMAPELPAVFQVSLDDDRIGVHVFEASGDDLDRIGQVWRLACWLGADPRAEIRVGTDGVCHFAASTRRAGFAVRVVTLLDRPDPEGGEG